MQLRKWDKVDLSEALTTLYLRLNGYFFISGLIIHSDKKGENKTDIDCLAIRHRYHQQPERLVESDSFLRIPTNKTDLLICEIKSNEKIGEFNSPIKTDSRNLEKVLRWTGVIPEEDIESVSKKLHPLFNAGVSKEELCAGILHGDFSFRPLLSCPAATSSSDTWCLTGDEIFEFTAKCFIKTEPRPACSTQYDYNLWGDQYEPLVSYIKSKKELTFKSLYSALS